MAEEVALYSEPIPPTGAIDASAARKAIGRPRLRFWEVFLRETVQNSWDARIADAGPIDFSIEARDFDSSQLRVLREEVFVQTPPDPRGELLDQLLRADRMPVLIVSDSRTRGLAGATRADQAPAEGESTDFRSFAFSIGRDPGRKAGGGTYGFGKAVLYNASRARTCLVYTRTTVDDVQTDRFIVTTVGERFEADGRYFTGRHWWGVVEDGNVVLPVEGAAATRLADSLGLLTKDGGTGTTIAVIDPHEPDLDIAAASDMDAATDDIRAAILKWAWPHFAMPSAISIRFRLVFAGLEKTISISDDPEIEQFAQAYAAAIQKLEDAAASPLWPNQTWDIPLSEPTWERSGVLAIRRAFVALGDERPELANTVALMRQPRFVVRYEKVDPDPHGQYAAGVFIVTPALDEHFAKSEPVTHDAWQTEPGRSRYAPIRGAIRDIKEVARLQVAPPQTDESAANLSGVAQLSRRLGRTLTGLTGSGAEVKRRAPGGGGQVSVLTVRPAGHPRLVAGPDSRVVADFPVEVVYRPGSDLSPWAVAAEPVVVAEGGNPDDPSELASVDGWFVDGDRISTGPTVEAAAVAGQQHVAVRVHHSPEVAVRVKTSKVRSA